MQSKQEKKSYSCINVPQIVHVQVACYSVKVFHEHVLCFPTKQITHTHTHYIPAEGIPEEREKKRLKGERLNVGAIKRPSSYHCDDNLFVQAMFRLLVPSTPFLPRQFITGS